MDDRFRRNETCESNSEIVDAFLENVRLRDKISDLTGDEYNLPFASSWSYSFENKYLRDMYEWDRAPVMTVAECLDHDALLASVSAQSDEEISAALKRLVEELHRLNHSLLYVAHLSDRRLYSIIVRHILPAEIKVLPNVHSPIYWNFCSFNEGVCAGSEPEPDPSRSGSECESQEEIMSELNWLTYYAQDSQRELWQSACSNRTLPQKRVAPYPRAYITETADFH